MKGMKSPKALSIALLIAGMVIGFAALAHAPQRAHCPRYGTVAGCGTGYGTGSNVLGGYSGMPWIKSIHAIDYASGQERGLQIYVLKTHNRSPTILDDTPRGARLIRRFIIARMKAGLGPGLL
jgi:hypothetical protein